LISQPLNYYLKQVHGWTPLQISAYVTILNIPWMTKPLYGLVSDLVPIFGYRRKSYLLLAFGLKVGLLVKDRKWFPLPIAFFLGLADVYPTQGLIGPQKIIHEDQKQRRE